MLEAKLLLTPGPTMPPARIYEAMRRPTVHHRTPEFKEVFYNTAVSYQRFIDSEDLPILLACSGTGGMEASLRNFVNSGSNVLTVNAGKFGARWSTISRALGLEPIELNIEWGEAASETRVQELINKNKNASAICLTLCETSTAVLHPIPEIVRAIRESNKDVLIILDAISALATIPFSQKELDIDIVIAGSQKAFMLPPGLCMLSFSKRAWELSEGINPQSHYFDLKLERSKQASGGSAWTPAISLVFGLQEALAIMQEEGFNNLFDRHLSASKYVRESLKELGFKTIADEFAPRGLTGAFTPDSISPAQLRTELLTKHSIRIAGGQDHWKDSVIRVGHMGNFKLEDLEVLIGAIRDIL